MLEDHDTLLLTEVGVTEDGLLVRLLDGQVKRVNEELVDFLDRMSVIQVYKVGTVLARLEVVLHGKANCLGDCGDTGDALRSVND